MASKTLCIYTAISKYRMGIGRQFFWYISVSVCQQKIHISCSLSVILSTKPNWPKFTITAFSIHKQIVVQTHQLDCDMFIVVQILTWIQSTDIHTVSKTSNDQIKRTKHSTDYRVHKSFTGTVSYHSWWFSHRIHENNSSDMHVHSICFFCHLFRWIQRYCYY